MVSRALLVEGLVVFNGGSDVFMEPEESRVSESILQFNHSLAVGQRPLECSGFTIAEEIHGFKEDS